MKYSVIGLVLAMLFGVFFGSAGDMDPELHNAIFFSLMGIGFALHGVSILADNLCERCQCIFCRS